VTAFFTTFFTSFFTMFFTSFYTMFFTSFFTMFFTSFFTPFVREKQREENRAATANGRSSRIHGSELEREAEPREPEVSLA
jgi:hypothetical protein